MYSDGFSSIINLVFWSCLLGLISAVIAKNKGYSFLGWWFLGAALFIIALPLALMLKTNTEELEKAAISSGGRKCPYCAEIIKQEAIVCRFCGRDLNSLNNVSVTAVDFENHELNGKITQLDQEINLLNQETKKLKQDLPEMPSPIMAFLFGISGVVGLFFGFNIPSKNILVFFLSAVLLIIGALLFADRNRFYRESYKPVSDEIEKRRQHLQQLKEEKRSLGSN